MCWRSRTFWNANVNAVVCGVQLLAGQLLDRQPLKLVKKQQVGRFQDHLTVADVGPAISRLQRQKKTV